MCSNFQKLQNANTSTAKRRKKLVSYVIMHEICEWITLKRKFRRLPDVAIDNMLFECSTSTFCAAGLAFEGLIGCSVVLLETMMMFDDAVQRQTRVALQSLRKT
jgi:hypothetical protein